MRHVKRLLALAVLATSLALPGCGGGGRRAEDPDFVAFFTTVYETPVGGTQPTEPPARFSNQFPDDPATFDSLLGG
jgi:hypothetical protein